MTWSAFISVPFITQFGKDILHLQQKLELHLHPVIPKVHSSWLGTNNCSPKWSLLVVDINFVEPQSDKVNIHHLPQHLGE